jgi:hypothetical protein
MKWDESEILITIGLVIAGAGLWLWLGLAIALSAVGAVLTIAGFAALWQRVKR